MGYPLLFRWLRSIKRMVGHKRIFVFAENDKELADACAQIEKDHDDSPIIEVYTNPKDVLYQVSMRNFEEGYISQSPNKKSTTEIFLSFIHSDNPRIRLKTVPLHQ